MSKDTDASSLLDFYLRQHTLSLCHQCMYDFVSLCRTLMLRGFLCLIDIYDERELGEGMLGLIRLQIILEYQSF